jgi:hypothetical protein
MTDETVVFAVGENESSDDEQIQVEMSPDRVARAVGDCLILDGDTEDTRTKAYIAAIMLETIGDGADEGDDDAIDALREVLRESRRFEHLSREGISAIELLLRGDDRVRVTEQVVSAVQLDAGGSQSVH